MGLSTASAPLGVVVHECGDRACAGKFLVDAHDKSSHRHARTDASIERQSKGAEKRLVTADACVAFTNAISFGCD